MSLTLGKREPLERWGAARRKKFDGRLRPQTFDKLTDIDRQLFPCPRAVLDEALEIAQSHRADHRRPCTEPLTLRGNAAVTGIHRAIASTPEAIQNPPVIGTEGAGRAVNWNRTDCFEHPLAAIDFVSQLRRRQVAPRAVSRSMTANLHALRLECTQLRLAEKRGSIKPTRANEKRRAETTPKQSGKDKLKVGGVAIVHGESNVWLVANEIQHRFEISLVEPALAFFIIDFPRNRADAMKIEYE